MATLPSGVQHAVSAIPLAASQKPLREGRCASAVISSLIYSSESSLKLDIQCLISLRKLSLSIPAHPAVGLLFMVRFREFMNTAAKTNPVDRQGL